MKGKQLSFFRGGLVTQIDPEKNKKFHMEFLKFLYKSYPDWVASFEVDGFLSDCSIFKGDKDKEKKEAERNIYYLINKGYIEQNDLKYLKITPDGIDFLLYLLIKQTKQKE